MALDIDAGLHMAVELYLALLQGLTINEVLKTLQLGQIYIGLPAYTATVRTFAIVVTILTSTPTNTPPADVVDKLLQFYGTNY
jgi:hypothetical protein